MNSRRIKNWFPPIVWNWLRFRFGGFRVVDIWPDLPASGWQNAALEASKAYDEGVRRILEVADLEHMHLYSNVCCRVYMQIIPFVIYLSSARLGRNLTTTFVSFLILNRLIRSINSSMLQVLYSM